MVALAAGGATPGDVIRSVIYVVGDDRSVLAAVWDQFVDSDLAPAFTTASTLLGVTTLGYRDQLGEIDLTQFLVRQRRYRRLAGRGSSCGDRLPPRDG